MLVKSYLAWASQAPATERAAAAAMLARAYLDASLPPEDRLDAEAALTIALDDPAAGVRRALAEVLAAAENAPHHLVATLAADQSDVGALVLARSPLLTDDQLVDFAALGDTLAQIAIAMRARLSRAVAAAIAEIGQVEALIVLVRNDGASISEFSFRRMIERLGDDPEFREALLERPDLPPAIRLKLAEAVAESLARFVTRCGWLSPQRVGHTVGDACEQATLLIGEETHDADLAGYVGHLRSSGQLTPSVLLRSVLCGDVRLLAAALADLTGLPLRRVRGALAEQRGAAFSALYRRAGLPQALEPVFAAALASLVSRRITVREGESRLRREVVVDTIRVCEDQADPKLGRVLAVLHRFNAEAARVEAREVTAALATPAAQPVPVLQDLARAA